MSGSTLPTEISGPKLPQEISAELKQLILYLHRKKRKKRLKDSKA